MTTVGEGSRRSQYGQLETVEVATKVFGKRSCARGADMAIAVETRRRPPTPPGSAWCVLRAGARDRVSAVGPGRTVAGRSSATGAHARRGRRPRCAPSRPRRSRRRVAIAPSPAHHRPAASRGARRCAASAGARTPAPRRWLALPGSVSDPDRCLTTTSPPTRCQRSTVSGRTTTRQERQSHNRDSKARLARVAASIRRGFMPRSLKSAS